MKKVTNYSVHQRAIIDRSGLQSLLDALSGAGFRTLGPVVRDSAVVLDRITSVYDLPAGLSDQQDGGRYRLTDAGRPALFDHVVGQHSWKQFLYPSLRRLWTARRNTGSFTPEPASEDGDLRLALVGVRSCDLHALAIHDKVFMEGPFGDPYYQNLRRNLFIIAVNCTRPGGTCFCASMNTGPRATGGFDLALTELIDDSGHRLVVEIGTERGADVLGSVESRDATPDDIAAADDALQQAAASMGREIDMDGLKQILYGSFDDPHWEKIAERCLTCGNCTMVCPTCFCATIEDTTDLNGDMTWRDRRWDSCFTLGFSYIHGGSVRASDYSRYRQWLTHKLGYWQDQFGVPGCVGCGRCITWCPVGIDLTEEARTFRMNRSK